MALRRNLGTRFTITPVFAWTPSEIDTNAWYDAADTDTITEVGNIVSQWDDKSGNDYHAVQATGTKQPLLQTNTIYFDSADALTHDMTVSGAFTDITTYVVARVDPSTSSYRSCFGFGLTDSTYSISIRNAVAADEKYQTTTKVPDYGTSYKTVDFALGAYGILGYRFDVDGCTVNINGEDYISSTYRPGPFYVDRLAIGTTVGLGGGFIGQISEIVMVTDGTDHATRQQIEGYLAWKWGLTGNLPTNHPYKNRPPTFIPTPSPPVWNPLDIDPYAWFDASDTDSVIESTGSVSQWNDKSTNDRHLTQPTGGSQPSTGTRTQNSLNVIDFNGSTESLLQTGDLSTMPSGADKPVSYHIVQKMDIFSSPIDVSMGWGNSDDGLAKHYHSAFGSTISKIARADNAGAQDEVNTPMGSDIHSWDVVYTGTLMYIWRDGVLTEVFEYTRGSCTFNTFNVGAYERHVGIEFHFDGFMAELIVEELATSGDDIHNIAEYMNDKWGITTTRITEFDLVMGTGQSNMVGRSGTGPAITVDSSAWSAATTLSPLTPDGSCRSAFANEWYAQTGRAVIYLPRGSNDAALIAAARPANNWSKTGGTNYNNSVSTFNSAMATFGPNIKIVNNVVLWVQGETDGREINGTTVTPAIYQSEMIDLIDNFTADLTGGLDAFIVSELGALDSGSYEADFVTIRASQAGAVSARSTVAVMAFTGCKDFPSEGKMVDEWHYTQVGYDEMGTALAENGAPTI